MKILLTLLNFLLLCCQSQSQNKFPAKRPSDFSLSYRSGGGRSIYSENLFICKDSCIYYKNDGNKTLNKRFLLSNTKMDALYSMLQKNKFDQIEYKTEKNVYDRGGISISISWDNGEKQLKISNAERSFVNKNWEKQWYAVCTWLQNLIKEKIK